jgi:FixJ family two-component response regulator
MTYDKNARKNLRIPALLYMGTTLKARRNSPEHRALVLARFDQLTPCEKEVCVLHLIEGHPQTTVADWLGVSLRVVQMHLTHAVLKIPELRPLRTKAEQKTRHPRVTPFSQLPPDERGPFNADEI